MTMAEEALGATFVSPIEAFPKTRPTPVPWWTHQLHCDLYLSSQDCWLWQMIKRELEGGKGGASASLATWAGQTECSAEHLLAVACVLLSGVGVHVLPPRVEQAKPLSSL